MTIRGAKTIIAIILLPVRMIMIAGIAIAKIPFVQIKQPVRVILK
jgi:hypothetical protein